jgi:hypothetical protein
MGGIMGFKREFHDTTIMDIAEKRHKKHINSISGLVISMDYNE